MNKTITLFFVILLSINLNAQDKKVATYVTGEADDFTKAIFIGELVNSITNINGYVATERTDAFLNELSKEHGYQRSGNVDDNQISELGIQFGADYVCVVKISSENGKMYALSKLINVKKATVAMSNSITTSENNVMQDAQKLADNLFLGNFNESSGKQVAVYITGAINPFLSDVIGGELVNAITDLNGFVAVERTAAFLSEINKEQTYQRSGNVDDSQISELGKQFGANYVCVANVMVKEPKMYISCKLIDTEDATVAKSASQMTKKENIISDSKLLAGKLVGGRFSSFTETTNDLNLEMVAVEGGSFQMGSNSGDDDEKPIRRVTLSSYYIGKFEVTQAQWQAVMGNNPSSKNNGSCPDCPVESVSWNDVQHFISKLNAQTGKNYRLPTEAEWEFAARGGNKSNGYTYAGSNSIGAVAEYRGNNGETTKPVGGRQPNELGLYDMSGNVWEWCNDWYGNYSSYSQTDPQGASSGSYRVYRGGGWDFNATYCRVASSRRWPGW